MCRLLFLLWFVGPGLFQELRSEEIKAPSPELRRVDLEIPGILIDLRYATPDNFTGKVIYSNTIAWLRPETITRLRAAQKTLKRQGYQLVILDAYRPAWAQYKLWEAVPDANFLAPPKQGSRHTRGTTVDVALASLSGRRLEMPSRYDEFTARADHDFSDVPEPAKKHGIALRKAMFANGFHGVPAEWWHYDLKEWNRYPLIVEKDGKGPGL